MRIPTVFILATICLSAVAAGEGVPHPSVDFDADVVSWWAQHPLNPDNSDRQLEIVSAARQVNVKTKFGGDIQKAIDALPAEGGTLISPTGEYASGFRLFKSNVHFRGEDGTVIKGARGCAIAGCPEALDYGAFCAEWRVKNNSAYVACWEKRIRNVYFRNVTFDGADTARSLVRVHVAKGVLFDNCRFQNAARRDTGHGGLVSGTTGADNLWFRDCHFAGRTRYAVYWDGTFGSGHVNCRFEKGFGAGAILSLCNEDFTKDLNGNGRFEKGENRNTQFLVCYGCTFAGGLYDCLAITANDVLVTRCKTEGPVTRFARFNTKTSLINKRMKHFSYNLYVIDNTTDEVDAVVVVDANLDYVPPDQNNKSRVGRYVVKGNVVAKYSDRVREIGKVDGLNVVENNGPVARKRGSL